jgi:predicted phage terminase large subunit-like protein
MNAADPALQPQLETVLDLVGRLRLRHCPLAPTPRQEAFLRLPHQEALFGGAAGGGKSIALLMTAAQYSDVPGYDALIVRATLTELEHPGGLIELSHDWFAGTKASWSGDQRAWRFPTGSRTGADAATIRFGYLNSPADVNRYSGSAFSFLGFDELSHVEEISYRRMFRVLRQASTAPDLARSPDGLTLTDVPVHVRATANPGGPNHSWIKAYFVNPESRKSGIAFVPSRWADNPYLDLDDYAQQLAHLPLSERKRLMDGDWEIADEGEMFERSWFELIERDALPKTTRAVRYWDFAASQPTVRNPDPDYTVGLRLEIDDKTGIYYITGITRKRLHAGQVEQLVKATAEADGPHVEICIEQEPASNSAILAEYFKREALRNYAVRTHHPTGPKEARARVVAVHAENGRIKLVPGPHMGAFLDEIAVFPNGPHDDCVDALTGAHAILGVRRRPARTFVPRGTIPGCERPRIYNFDLDNLPFV